eukprot:396270_1
MGNQVTSKYGYEQPISDILSSDDETDVDDLTDLDDISEFLDKGNYASPEENLQRLWIRDSLIWAKKFNGKRNKFVKMVQLSRTMNIKSINCFQNKNSIQFVIDAALIINEQNLSLQLTKYCKTGDECIDINALDTNEWKLNIEYKNKNAHKIIVDALESKQTDNNKSADEIEKFVTEFSDYILKWFSSNNVEQFRMKIMYNVAD